MFSRIRDSNWTRHEFESDLRKRAASCIPFDSVQAIDFRRFKKNGKPRTSTILLVIPDLSQICAIFEISEITGFYLLLVLTEKVYNSATQLLVTRFITFSFVCVSVFTSFFWRIALVCAIQNVSLQFWIFTFIQHPYIYKRHKVSLEKNHTKQGAKISIQRVRKTDGSSEKTSAFFERNYLKRKTAKILRIFWFENLCNLCIAFYEERDLNCSKEKTAEIVRIIFVLENPCKRSWRSKTSISTASCAKWASSGASRSACTCCSTWWRFQAECTIWRTSSWPAPWTIGAQTSGRRRRGTRRTHSSSSRSVRCPSTGRCDNARNGITTAPRPTPVVWSARYKKIKKT